MGQEDKNSLNSDQYPDTTVHIGDALWSELDRLERRVEDDADAISVEDKRAEDRALYTRRTDLEHEAAAVDAERRDLLDYSEQLGGDSQVDELIQTLKKQDLDIAVERGNIPQSR